ncbi:importin alpha re-exporter [Guyanagaster necrorhizus]|uniref:Importin alpha re-exporter n=1 Tax=Guyanagaster necrorhizus TaxID=856835 RepID=A0A9P7W2J2_9AGAR|nr:importin alpha re-exporter [Guyanagaster necrorhizus MCA 3950]KAG7451472.1 importin alpha re-exporter [Guyanagaster necrorhizus MCA 3950]
MSDLPQLLLASLNPATRKQAEQSLDAFSAQQGFLSHLLSLVLDQSQERAVRLSGSVYLKNIAKLKWEEDVQPLTEQDKVVLRSELVPAMLALSNPSDKAIRAQVAESVSLIAELDFPEKWPNLIDQLVSSLSATDYNINYGVLQTAHSIFNQWRAHVRSDQLFTEINFVFSKFMDPFLQLFRQTATLLLSDPSPNPALTTPTSNYTTLAQCMVLLVEIFHDFTCQDLPPAIEDAHAEFFGTTQGWFHTFMPWNPQELRGEADDPTPSLPAQIKTRILEIAELFLKLYPEQLQQSGAVQTLVQGVWSLVGSNQLPNISDDHLVSQALRFISTAIRSGHYQPLFSSPNIVSSLVEGVVVPNTSLREHDVEQFEDDPLEYIRLDLSLSSAGTDLATRRHSAADVLQALVSSGYETATTEIVGKWIETGLKRYEANKTENWRAKDSAIYLLTAVATKGSTTQQGVTSTNTLVDVIKFFSEHVFQDLEASAGSVHPILQVDAIRFLYTFRNQLTKPQLMSVLPLLIRHLGSANYVCCTYAAITIDRILFIKQGGQLLFTQTDIHDFAADLLNALLTKIESAKTPEKMAENDHLMKCVMRVIFTAREGLAPGYEQTLARLVAILGVISKNPSNPKFDQYIFESISGLIRFIARVNPANLTTFEQVLFGPFTVILQQDIDQYIPYVFQLLAQMLEMHSKDVPTEYRSLLPFLLMPAIWQQKGSIPGLVKLLSAYLSRDSAQMVANRQIATVLGVIQQRLIPSKQNDGWGFELLQAVVRYVDGASLQQYFRDVIMTILKRMQATKTDKFIYLFTQFLLFSIAIEVPGGLSVDFIIGTIESIQPNLWSQILINFILPEASRIPIKDRKVAVVGLTRLLTGTQYMLIEPSVRTWSSLFTVLVRQFNEPQYLEGLKDDTAVGLTEIDYEEATAGYQAAFSRLAC